MTTTLYIILAVVPSILWLLFYLRKDKHPEPNKMVIKIFFWGILAALGALLFEFLYQEALTAHSIGTVFFSRDIKNFLASSIRQFHW